jgi:hypothetical protein
MWKYPIQFGQKQRFNRYTSLSRKIYLEGIGTMKKFKTESAQTKQEPNSQNTGLVGIKPALIRQDMLKEGAPAAPEDSWSDVNPFGTRVINGVPMLTFEAIDYQYSEIRRVFFPGFDPIGEWTVCPGYSPYVLGAIRFETKEIMYSADLINKPIVVLNRILIHELCHAVVKPRSCGHGKRWRTGMEKVAQVAEAIGDVELAEYIRDDYRSYDPDSGFCEPPLNAITVYEAIRRWVEEEPDWPFESVMYEVGVDYFEPHELLIEKFKKCHEVFEKAKKQVSQ